MTAGRQARPPLTLLSEPEPVDVFPSADETLYLRAGRMERAHHIHAGLAPDFATDFSSSRAVYAPLGVMAASTGGLGAARLPSLPTMPGATAALQGITRRLGDRRAALLAVALFAGVSSTQYLGPPVTYDVMAVAMVALATWLRSCRPAGPQTGRTPSPPREPCWLWPVRPDTLPPR